MRLVSLSFLSVLSSLVFAFAAQAAPLRPSDLVAAPERHLNRAVDILIVEPLYGPSTPAALATLEYGQVRVQIPEAVGAELVLVPAAYRPEDPNRYRKKFDRVMQPPVWVKGEFLKDEDLAKSTRREQYVIRVSSWETAVLEKPVRVSLEELKADPSQWDRKQVIYDGMYENRFEVSALDKEIWLSFSGTTEVSGQRPKPSDGKQRSRVRVTGVLFSKPSAHYGHLGGYPFEILASKVEHLNPN